VHVADRAAVHRPLAVLGVDHLARAGAAAREQRRPRRTASPVDPGSNGSASAVAAVLRASARWLASARTSPPCGSSTTMSPPVAPMRATASASARSQISCSAELMVSATVCPGCAATDRTAGDSKRPPRASRRSWRVPCVPRSSVSSASSTPSTGAPSGPTRPTMRRTGSDALRTRCITGTACTPRVAVTAATSLGSHSPGISTHLRVESVARATHGFGTPAARSNWPRRARWRTSGGATRSRTSSRLSTSTCPDASVTAPRGAGSDASDTCCRAAPARQRSAWRSWTCAAFATMAPTKSTSAP
jgi:hypothetical protein